MIDLMAPNDEILRALSRSKFRASFHLPPREEAYFFAKGAPTIRSHAEDFVRARLAPAEIPNDGRQTPMKNHPAFVAQHACACCCRGCLNRWYNIPKNVELTEAQQRKIVDLLTAWIAVQTGK